MISDQDLVFVGSHARFLRPMNTEEETVHRLLHNLPQHGHFWGFPSQFLAPLSDDRLSER